jgi:hypothetical protein
MSREADDDGSNGGQSVGAPWLIHLAHDLRGPLSPLAMAVSLLQTGRAGPAQQPELYALMQRQIESLTQLLDDTADLLVLRARPAQAVDLVSLLDMLKIKYARRLRAAEAMLDIAAAAAPVPVVGEMRDLLRLVGALVLRCVEIGGAGCIVHIAADAAPRLTLRLGAAGLAPDAVGRCEQIAAVLTAPSQAHVADAMSATVLRRYDITLATTGDAPGFEFGFRGA